jgi:predicted phage terminase large subunit-like protein
LRADLPEGVGSFFMENIELIAQLWDRLAKNPGSCTLATDMFEVIRLYEAEDPASAHEMNAELRKHIIRQIQTAPVVKLYDLYKRSLLFDSLVSFDAYCQYLEFDREPSKRFYLPRRRILRPLVEGLQDLHDGKLDLLTISLPPGVGKTTLGTFFLSWEMGLKPDMPNLASAHADKLTRSIYDGVNTIIQDPEYLWGSVFPGLSDISTNAKDETIDLGSPKRFKTLTCRSIDGSLTGATRAENILYSDDLVSGIEEALSKERMDTLWTKVTNDLKSRKKQDCKELHIATRWSIHDPIGRLERQYDRDPRARFIRMPALDGKGESNFDYDHRVGFNTQYFVDMRNTLDDVSWRCLFQQEPIEREGQLYPEDELRRYFQLPTQEGKPDEILPPDVIFGICDTAEGGGDDTFLPVAYAYGDDYYIEDCVCDPGLPQVTVPLCANILVKHRVRACEFESNSAGTGIADKVEAEVRSLGGHTHITKKRTTSNKLTKIIVNSDFVKKHFLFKDRSRYLPGSPYGRMMSLMTGFTVTGKSKTDDVPDGLAQLSEYIQSLAGRQVEVFKRPY